MLQRACNVLYTWFDTVEWSSSLRSHQLVAVQLDAAIACELPAAEWPASHPALPAQPERRKDDTKENLNMDSISRVKDGGSGDGLYFPYRSSERLIFESGTSPSIQ